MSTKNALDDILSKFNVSSVEWKVQQHSLYLEMWPPPPSQSGVRTCFYLSS